ncbi:hypothetical protein PT2222_60338 [Paraburkholderia tropica]
MACTLNAPATRFTPALPVAPRSTSAPTEADGAARSALPAVFCTAVSFTGAKTAALSSSLDTETAEIADSGVALSANADVAPAHVAAHSVAAINKRSFIGGSPAWSNEWDSCDIDLYGRA